MRIRDFFLVCFCAVAVPGATAAGWLALDAWSDLQRTEAAQLATRAVSDAQRAQSAIAVEVGAFSGQLQLANPDVETLRRSGQVTEQRLTAAVASAREGGFKAQLAEDVLARIRPVRQRTMEELARPLAARDPELPKITQALRNEGVEALSGLAFEAARRVFATSPEASALINVANSAMDYRDFIGRRSTSLTAWIGGAPIDPKVYESMLVYTGRMEQSWAAAQRQIKALPDLEGLQAALREQAAARGPIEARWQEIMQKSRIALDGGNPDWGTTVPEFRPWSVASQAEILKLRDAALDEAMTTTDTQHAASQTVFLSALGLALLMAASALVAVLMLMSRIVRPVQALTGCVTRIAGGDLDLEVPHGERRDELGEMAAAVETLRRGSAERLEMVTAQHEAQQQQIERAQRVGQLLKAFEQETAGMLRTVASAAAEMDATAGGMATIAATGKDRASLVAGASERASGNVQTVAAAAEELSASIAEVARQVRDSAARAEQASAAAQQTDRTVRGLSEAAARIGDVVQLIAGIASQTNLLALNATIEAARAGEAGKGFAVVAGEVKNLASQTAKATGEISQQIATMQAETERTAQEIGGIAQMIVALNEATAVVAEAAGQQAEATREIGSAVAQAAVGTQEASHHAAGVSEDAERTGRAAEDVRGASSELARQADSLRSRMEQFLTALRAA
ncbi:methyl-accepting chemotaxis protein [Roseomonas sp. E05]|uniref:methyl-accepting chemotaxis protein n=1 Tax=Roseomonas sp. E05 TaxID=3046310 RepID=UPI0024B97E8D|nr:methyl-accepting chemotaxis protein [Roseomonas sp. E05]MDJ0388137.1 methyl-accepting chemotaxis protein [Roseomonas sp. E05]